MTMPLLARPVALREADLRHDAARIDVFVRAQPAATPFHLAGWCAAVERGTGQRAHYLIAEYGDASIAGVLPLTAMRSLLFGRALVSTGFGVGGGILAADDHVAAALGNAAWSLAHRLGIASVELRGGVLPADWEVDDITYLGFARGLATGDEAELLAVPRKQRAEVRKALAADLAVTVGRDRAALAEHYRVYAESVRNLGTPVFPASLLREVASTLDADVLTVNHQGRAVSSVLSFYMSDTVYPYWGGGNFSARELRANDRMYFALMAHARARGCTRFDFGRSKAGTGAAAFKKNWGFAPEPLTYARRSDGPAREINPLSPKYVLMTRSWKRLPLWAANTVGPWIARGLG